jgi:hypothetical protein
MRRSGDKKKMAIVWPNDLPVRFFDYAEKIPSSKQFDLGVALGCLLFAMSCNGADTATYNNIIVDVHAGRKVVGASRVNSCEKKAAGKAA